MTPPTQAPKSTNSPPSRYHRQMLLDGFGADAQQRLAESRVLVVGCGALGTVIVDALTRAGVGHITVVDRDVVETTNLQRQVLFDEADAEASLPKAVVAAERLRAINSGVTNEPVVADFNPANAPRLTRDVDLLIDGTDNFQTRYLLNDIAVRNGLPYVYGGAVSTTGSVYPILPHTPGGETAYEGAGVAGPCLRCIEPDPPAPGAGPTCDTVGVLGPLASLVASAQAVEALKILTGQWSRVRRTLLAIDAYANSFKQLDVSAAYETGACVCCGGRRFDFLEGVQAASAAVSLCGRNAIQIAAPNTREGGGEGIIDLDALATRLETHGPVTHNAYMVRVDLCESGRDIRITLFPDGRAVIYGTDDPGIAKSIYARYVGL